MKDAFQTLSVLMLSFSFPFKFLGPIPWKFMTGVVGHFTLQPMARTNHTFPGTGARDFKRKRNQQYVLTSKGQPLYRGHNILSHSRFHCSVLLGLMLLIFFVCVTVICRCLPYFGNVVPMSNPRDNVSSIGHSTSYFPLPVPILTLPVPYFGNVVPMSNPRDNVSSIGHSTSYFPLPVPILTLPVPILTLLSRPLNSHCFAVRLKVLVNPQGHTHCENSIFD